MEFLGTYRGAALYKVVNDLDVPEEEVLTKKVRSEGIHPSHENFKVEFSAEGENWKEVKKRITQEIDKYLEEHELKEFDIDQLDIKKI